MECQHDLSIIVNKLMMCLNCEDIIKSPVQYYKTENEYYVTRFDEKDKRYKKKGYEVYRKKE